MNTMLKVALPLLLVSAGSVVWGVQYRTERPMATMNAFFGKVDKTYELAGWVAGLGALAFLIGVAFLVAGLVQASRTPPPPGDGASS